MMKSNVVRPVIVTLIALILISIMSAVAAGNIVPPTRLDDQSFAITANALAPADCSSLSLTNVVTGTGFIFGTGGNDLILSGGNDDFIVGLGGGDCIVGGGGDDTIIGGAGTDVCIGGLGIDAFFGPTCETQIQ